MTDTTAPRDDLAGFLDTGLDLTTDGITEAERERTLAWYREHHDHRDLDLAPFARFQLRHDPRRSSGSGASCSRWDACRTRRSRSPSASCCSSVVGNGKGDLYEIVAVRGSDREKIVNLHLALMNEGYYQMSLGYFLLSSEVGEAEIDGFLAALERSLHTLGYVT